jgi:arsenate reductase
MRILILCTGNSCRSQMAEAYLASLDSRLSVSSAGTRPAQHVHPLAIRAMAEDGIDLSGHKPKAVDRFLPEPFDYVITVCDNARESCPVFAGRVRHRLHIGFDDPAEATGSTEEVVEVFRRVRDEIREGFRAFYRERLLPEMERDPA